MKKLFTAAILAGTILSANAQDTWTTPDKKLHFGAGFLISMGVTAQTKNPWYGFGSGCAVGALKEVSDRSTTGFSSKDLVVTCLGAAVGGATTNWLITRQNDTNYISFRKEFN